MMKKIILISLIVFIGVTTWYFLNQSTTIKFDGKETPYYIPKVAFLTSGTNKGNGLLPSGAVVALQTFNSQGVYTKIESRDILFDSEKMNKYSIMILSTAVEYYDVDKKYSLTFMSDAELLNLSNWVKNGGILIAGDNIGRNMPDATDRLNIAGKLNPSNWLLGECFGISLEERNMNGFRLEGNITDSLKGIFIETSTAEQWGLVTDSVYSKQAKILAQWMIGNKTYPALIENKYGKGIGFLLPTSYLLHPANNSGKWGEKQIASFYKYVLSKFYATHPNKITLNPWPSAFDQAFCITLNAEGEQKDYEFMLSYLKSENLIPSLFVDGNINKELKNYLMNENINLESNGFKKMNYRDHNFVDAKTDLLENINYWNKDFEGFRFPYTRNSTWGMLALDDMGYKFDSSIGADNINDFNGSVVPYNLPIATSEYYKISTVLEISPTLHDDYYFYMTNEPSNKDQQEKNASLFEKYLINYWNYAVKPYKGAMVFMSHPLYSGKSDITIRPLKKIIEKVKKENTWMTTIENIADYRINLDRFQFNIQEEEKNIQINIAGPDKIKVEDVTLQFTHKPLHIQLLEGKYQLIERNKLFYLIFDAFNGQNIKLKF
jgi:hypothetical protein